MCGDPVDLDLDEEDDWREAERGIMTAFAMGKLREAYAHADAGGQALHLMEHSGGLYPNAPTCFRRTRRFAHLIDNNRERLVATARRLGVRRIVVSRDGKRGQHIDLCGRPLERAIAEAS
jgi:hypothetical protein